MQDRLRRFWVPLAIAVVALMVLTVHVAVDYWCRTPPNYSQIEEGLWLGGNVAQPPPGTQAVLNLCEAEDGYRGESQKWAPIRDAAPAPDLDWLRAQVGFIKSERAAHRTVYVHCMNGASRSGMVMAAYLMQREGWSRDQAIQFLRLHRPAVRPNPAFLQLLVEWEGATKP